MIHNTYVWLFRNYYAHRTGSDDTYICSKWVNNSCAVDCVIEALFTCYEAIPEMFENSSKLTKEILIQRHRLDDRNSTREHTVLLYQLLQSALKCHPHPFIFDGRTMIPGEYLSIEDIFELIGRIPGRTDDRFYSSFAINYTRTCERDHSTITTRPFITLRRCDWIHFDTFELCWLRPKCPICKQTARIYGEFPPIFCVSFGEAICDKDIGQTEHFWSRILTNPSFGGHEYELRAVIKRCNSHFNAMLKIGDLNVGRWYSYDGMKNSGVAHVIHDLVFLNSHIT